MNWDRCLVVCSQLVVIVVLGTLVGLGHNSAIQDGLLAVSGSVAGLGLYKTVVKQP